MVHFRLAHVHMAIFLRRMHTFFGSGDVILLRGLDEHHRVIDVKPVRVVQDDADLSVLWLQRSTATMKAVLYDHTPGTPRRWEDGSWQLEESVWRHEILILTRPAERRATWVRWTADRDFYGWYVNMQSPMQRTRLGFDHRDHQLDILVDPDRNWRWKDEDELDLCVEIGRMTATMALEVRQEGQRAIRQIEANAPPLSDGWESWCPDPTWTPPGLPEDWDDLSMYESEKVRFP
ncbi:MAG: DUF402 domain-containing protein [Gemmatimonadetes bacterium]|jgi:hypothetical protein|nr:DUF402 domain-containing protein [Gemmatimonadota bacterium]